MTRANGWHVPHLYLAGPFALAQAPQYGSGDPVRMLGVARMGRAGKTWRLREAGR